jgi:hypothetical protein
MHNERNNLLAFSKKVEELRTAQKAYFRAHEMKLDAHSKLIEAKKIEAEVDKLIRDIEKDHKEANQANLFEPVLRSVIVKSGLTDPKELADLYGQKVAIEWLNNDESCWVPQDGRVNAITIRMAEMSRVRNMAIRDGKEVYHG